MEEATGKTQDFSILAKDLSTRLSSINSLSSSLTTCRNSFMDLKISALLSHYTLFLYKSYQEQKQAPDTTSKPLTKLKCFIDRLKPLDHKLQYQLDKIAQGTIDSDLRMKPNPNSLDSQLRVTEKKGIYKPPKMQAVIFKDKKTERDEERLKKKLARSTLVKNLKEELTDAPVEIKSGKSKRLRDIEEMQTKFEEDNFTRVVLTKQEKKMRRKIAKEDNEDDTEDVNALLKLIRSDKSKLKDSLSYSKKKQKLDEY
jgi:hypothetical protein